MTGWHQRNDICLSLALAVLLPNVLFAQAKPLPPKKPVPKLPGTPAKSVTPAKPTTPPKPVPKIATAPTLSPAQAFEKLEKLFQEGKFSEALAAAREFQKNYPISGLLPGAMYYEGWAAYNLKLYPDGAAAFERLLTAYPTSELGPEAWLKQAECLREMKEFDRAVAIFAAFPGKYPKHPFVSQAMLGQALTLFAKKDYTGAKQMLSRYRELYSDEWENSFDGLFLYAQILNEEKNFAEAQRIYEMMAARTSNPRAAEGLYLAAQNLFDAQKYAQALSFFKRVPSNGALLASVDQQIAALNANRSTIVAQSGREGFNSRLQSLQNFRNQLQARPDLRPSALFRVANCYQLQGRMEEAGIAYQFLLDKYPGNAIGESAHYGLIETLMERKLMDAANKQIEVFKAKYPNSVLIEGADIRQAEALFNTRKFAEALAQYIKSKEKVKEAKVLETVDFRIASCHLELAEWERAVESFTAFMTAHPQSKAVPDALFRQGRCYFELANAATEPAVKKSQLEKAIKCFERIQAEFPLPEVLPDVVFQLGYLYNYLAVHDPVHFDNAVAKFQEFWQTWPTHRLAPEVLYLIARTRAVQQKYPESIAAYTELINKFPNDPKAADAAYERATTYFAAGTPDDMVTALREFADKYPENPKVGDALYAIAFQLEEAGRRLLTSNDPTGAATKFGEAEAAYQKVVVQAGKAPAGEEGKALRDAAIGAQIKIVTLQEQRNAVDDAITGCEKFIEQFADYPLAGRQIINQMAALYRKAKQPAQGYAKFDQLRSKYQANSALRIAALTATIELANSERDNLRANQAAAQLLADPEADKLPAITFAAIGETLLKTEQCERARDAYTKMQAAYASDAGITRQAVLGLAKAQLCLKQYDEAEKWFRQVADAPPEAGGHADAELGLGKVAETRGKLTEAVDHYNKVLKLTRTEVASEAAFRLGTIFYNMTEKDPKKSKENTKAALAYYARLVFATGPMADEAMFMLGACHDRLGTPDAAKAAYQNYLKRFPDGKFADQAKERVKVLIVPVK
jgi:TolA-binding protein